jgi:hypothetical protein
MLGSEMHKDTLARLESIGVEAVLIEMAEGKHGQPTSQMREGVESWLRSKAVASEAVASARRDAREEETLSIARKAIAISEEANAISERATSTAASARESSRRANAIAIIAIVFATATAIMAAYISRP